MLRKWTNDPALIFWQKYGGMCLYDIDLKNKYKFDHKYIRFVRTNVCCLIGNSVKPYGPSIYHEYFSINDLFDII